MMKSSNVQYPNTTELMPVMRPPTLSFFIEPGADHETQLEQIGQFLSHLDIDQIEDLLSRHPKLAKKQVEIHLDYENLHISLEKMGWVPQPKILVKTIKSAVRNLGIITSIKAYADWGFLRKSCSYDIQRELEMNGVKTHYTLRGKNSADIAMVNGLRDALEEDKLNQSKVDVLVVGTGDGDFQPIIETIKKRGKQAVILACKNSLSQLLKREASQLIYLTDYLNLTELRQHQRYRASMDEYLARAG